MNEISIFILTDDLTQPEMIEAHITGKAKLEVFAN
jgi:hypothetical protein